MEYSKDISIIVPLFNEEESLGELFSWIRKVMEENGFSYEVIFVDDGSTDGSWKVITEIAGQNSNVRGISFRRNYGKSAALFHGFEAASGRVVFTMDADLQDSPEELPEMYRMITVEGWDVVSGWKQHRQDNKVTKNLPSKLYNATARWITGIRLHDMNCGLKAYRNEVVKSIEVYGEMHRYIPYLAKNAGYTRITEKPVHHQKRYQQIRNREVCQWFPRPSFTLVPEHFRQETDAFLRFHRLADVPDRIHNDRLDHCRQTDQPVRASEIQGSDRPATVLSCHPDSSSRSDAVPGRFHLRNDFPEFKRTEQIQH